MRASEVAVVRAEDRDLRDSAWRDGTKNGTDLPVDGFDQRVVERAIAPPHRPIGGDERLPLVFLEIVPLRKRLVPEIVGQIRRKLRDGVGSRVWRRPVEDAVDVVRVQPGDDQEERPRLVRGALPQVCDDAAGESPIVNL